MKRIVVLALAFGLASGAGAEGGNTWARVGVDYARTIHYGDVEGVMEAFYKPLDPFMSNASGPQREMTGVGLQVYGEVGSPFAANTDMAVRFGALLPEKLEIKRTGTYLGNPAKASIVYTGWMGSIDGLLRFHTPMSRPAYAGINLGAGAIFPFVNLAWEDNLVNSKGSMDLVGYGAQLIGEVEGGVRIGPGFLFAHAGFHGSAFLLQRPDDKDNNNDGQIDDKDKGTLKKSNTGDALAINQFSGLRAGAGYEFLF